ncbi:hypothetical protein ACFL0X_01470 [Nanoarchaeota archaeon]
MTEYPLRNYLSQKNWTFSPINTPRNIPNRDLLREGFCFQELYQRRCVKKVLKDITRFFKNNGCTVKKQLLPGNAGLFYVTKKGVDRKIDIVYNLPEGERNLRVGVFSPPRVYEQIVGLESS